MPLILLWVGINDTARIVIIVLSAVPATLVVVMEGVKTVDTSLLKAAQVLRGQPAAALPVRGASRRPSRSSPPASGWASRAA